MKQFVYGTILVSLFFESVPLLRPQVAFTKMRARDPSMLRWVELMAHHGGRGSKFKYGAAFFRWLDDQLLMIEDYMYAGTDFRGDPYLALSVDQKWEELGE